MARIVESLRPRVVVIENVLGLLNRGLRHVLARLADLGMDAVWGDLSAAEVGAPHLRRRIFVVAGARGRVPDAFCERVWVEWERQREQHAIAQASELGNDGEDGTLAYAGGERREGKRQPQATPAQQGALWHEPERRSAEERRRSAPSYWRSVPEVGRVVDGPSSRLDRDRLRVLGNSVVPQVAQVIGEAVMAGLS